jgi:hypothetical protein
MKLSGLHVVIWSFTGYDSLGNIVLTLSPPHHFPRAVVGAIILSFLTYSTAVIGKRHATPLLFVLLFCFVLGLLGAPSYYTAVPNFSEWKANYFSHCAFELGGVVLEVVSSQNALFLMFVTTSKQSFMTSAALLSCYGTFQVSNCLFGGVFVVI